MVAGAEIWPGGPEHFFGPRSAQRCGTQERSAILFSALKKMGVALDVEQAFDVEQTFDMEQLKDVEQAQRCGTGPKMWNTGNISNTFQCFKKNECRPRSGTSL